MNTIAQFKDSVAGLLSGLDLSNVANLNGALERAARVLVQKADIPEASGIQNIVLYQGVFDYPCDTRIFGTAITDIRPQGISRPPSNFVFKKFGDDFDRTKQFRINGTMATFEYSNGTPIIRIASEIPQQEVVIDAMNSATDWVASGAATNLVQDNAVYYQAPASLRFNLSGLGTGVLTKTLQSPLSLSSYQDVGVAFLAIRIPEGTVATDISSVSLKLGSNSSDYNLVTESEGFLGSWISGEWLLVAFDFSSSSVAGVPNWSSIQYVQVLVGVLGAVVNFRVGGLFICQPSPSQILYQSAAIFLPADSQTALTTITANTDRIILNDAAYTLYEYEGALSVLQQTSGGKGDSMSERLKDDLDGNGVNTFGLYGRFRGDNPSQELRQSGNYYDDARGGYNAR